MAFATADSSEKDWCEKNFFFSMRGCRPLTDSEIYKILEPLTEPRWLRERTLVLLGLRAGLRLSCMLSLRVGDVAIDGKVGARIRVRRATVKGKRKGRDLPLHRQAAAALQELIDSLRDRSPCLSFRVESEELDSIE